MFEWRLPDIVFLAECLALSDKACARLVQEHLALVALEAGRVPLQVGSHAEDVLVVDGTPAPHAKRELAGTTIA